jgi:hypothetical protein
MVAGRRSGSGSIVYDADTMEASVEEFALTDGKLRGIWGGCLNRVVFRMREPAQKGSVVVRIEQR